MNAFTIAAFALLLGFVPLAIVCIRRRELDGVAALQLCGTLTTLIFLCLAEGFHRPAYYTVPVISAAATWIGGLVFARFLGRYIG